MEWEKIVKVLENESGFIHRGSDPDCGIIDEFKFQIDECEFFSVVLASDGSVGWSSYDDGERPADRNLEEVLVKMKAENTEPSCIDPQVLEEFARGSSQTIEYQGWYLKVVNDRCIWNVSSRFVWGWELDTKLIKIALTGDLIDFLWDEGMQINYDLDASLRLFHAAGYSVIKGCR